MGDSSEMTFVFKREKHARWAAHLVEGILKVALARQAAPDEELGLGDCRTLMGAYFAHEAGLRDFDPTESDPHCALVWTRRRGTRVVVERCADVQGAFALRPDALNDEPFPQICLACATRFPQVPFAAYCRHEQTTSGAVELTRAAWDGERLRLRRLQGELPFDETAWDTWDMLELHLRDGELVVDDDVRSPLRRHYEELLDEACEAASAGDVAGALYLLAAAEALPGCAERPEAAIQRGLAANHLRRSGIRRVRALWTREVPEGLRDELAAAEPVTETSLDQGRFVLRASEGCFEVIDTRDGSVAGEGHDRFNREPTRVIHDFLVLSGGRYYLIDWEYVAEPPLTGTW